MAVHIIHVAGLSPVVFLYCYYFVLHPINKYDFPVALKEDGCWAGNGVTICNSIENIESKFNSLGNKPFLIQKFIDGVSSQVGLSGINGEVSGYFSFNKIEHTHKNGPASVIEFLHHKPLLETAKSVFKKSCYTGFCGIDFIIDRNNVTRISDNLTSGDFVMTPTHRTVANQYQDISYWFRLVPGTDPLS